MIQEKILALNVFVGLLKDFDYEKIKSIYDNNLWQNWFLEADMKTLELLSNYKLNYEDLASDYTSLFISDIEFVKSPQSSSFYLDDKKMMYSCVSDEVKNLYISNGFFAFYNDLFADNLINELLFVKYLLENNKRDILKNFLNNHFFNWFFVWVEDMNNGAKTDFYKGLALLMREYFKKF